MPVSLACMAAVCNTTGRTNYSYILYYIKPNKTTERKIYLCCYNFIIPTHIVNETD